MTHEELKAYLDRNLSIRQISKESKKSYTSVRHWLSKYGLKPKFKSFKEGHDYSHRKKIDEQGRRYCPYCETYKEIEEFYARRGTNSSGWCRQCVAKQTIERGRKLKADCVEYKGGKCQKCGYNKCQGALDFHHRDPKEKDFSICKKYGCRKITDRIRRELDKCDLLCANCHREQHFEEASDKWKF